MNSQMHLYFSVATTSFGVSRFIGEVSNICLANIKPHRDPKRNDPLFPIHIEQTISLH